MNRGTSGHFLATATIVVWSITYISTKILLRSLAPAAILFYRFSLAYLVLLAIHPKNLRPRGIRQELPFFGLGLAGIAAYYTLESLALRHTLVSNVGLIISTAPLFTAVLAHCAGDDEKAGPGFLIGCLTAAAGVALIVCNGSFVLRISPVGDLLALAASVSWAVYCIMLKRVGRKHHPIYVTRKTFFYGLIALAILLAIQNPGFRPRAGITPPLLAHLAFLGVIASSLCFVMWGQAVRFIGVLSASNYIYLVPLLTALTSALVLGERVTALTLLGGALILGGVYAAEKTFRRGTRPDPLPAGEAAAAP